MNLISKKLTGYPRNGDRFRVLPTGVGRELKNLLGYLDQASYGLENGLNYEVHGSSEADLKVAGRTGDVLSFLGGWPAGYEKATKQWEYTTGKYLIITAIKPGELGDLIRIVFASGTDDAVAVDGMTITITIDNDSATVPADLQALVTADPRAKGMIAITSTDATAIPDAFAAAGPSGYLENGAGLGLGFDIQNNQTWGNAAAIAFVATTPGKAAAGYEIAWVDDAGATGPTVVATRKRCTITLKMGTDTVAEVVAAVNADGIASEHVLAVAAGAGSGAITGLDTKVYTLGLDFGTMVQAGDVMATITGITTSAITYDYGAQVAVTATTTANVRARLGLTDLGSMSFPTIA